LRTDNPSNPVDKMLLQVLLNQLQSEYAMLLNAIKMSKIAQLFPAAKGKECSREQLAGGPGRRSPQSNSGAAIRGRSRGWEARQMYLCPQPALRCFAPCWGHLFRFLSSL